MDSEISRLIKKFSRCAGASEEVLSRLVSAVSRPLPADYLEYLRFSDGGEGFVGRGGFLRLWPADQILQKNRDLEVQEYAPGLLLLGSDGAGISYGVDLEGNADHPCEFIAVHTLDLGDEHYPPERIAPTFRGLLEYLSRIK